jgi:hypothetical protein
MPKFNLNPDLSPLAHGASVEGMTVVKGVSQGPGVPVQVNNPKRGLPKRGYSGFNASSVIKVEGGKIYATPNNSEGEDFAVLVEY